VIGSRFWLAWVVVALSGISTNGNADVVSFDSGRWEIVAKEAPDAVREYDDRIVNWGCTDHALCTSGPRPATDRRSRLHVSPFL